MVDIKIPSVGESITEVTIGEWLVGDGDVVAQDDPICSIESDKASLEIPAPSGGAVKISVEEGETVDIGAVIGKIDPSKSSGDSTSKEEPKKQADAQEAPNKEESSSSRGDKNYPSPAANKLMNEKGIDSSKISGSGKDGRITKGDVLSHVDKDQAPSESSKQEKPKVVSSQTQSSFSGSRETELKKMSPLRKTIAKKLLAAKNETAMLTTFNEVDMSAVMDLRKKYKEGFKEKHGVGLGFMSFFVKACTKALQDFPAVNGQIQDNSVLYHDYADIGVAVSTPRGLVVPVLRNAEVMSMHGIESKIIELATKARDGKISIEEMTGGTFTITNGGIFGSMLSTPIINAPQSAILGMHNIVQRPVAINGEVKIRPIMYLALSYDHRIVDGKESVSFLKMVKELIEDPSRLLLDI